MRWMTIAVALSLVACSGGTPSRVESEARPPRTSAASTPSWALHEWGLVSVTGAGLEVAAGPGQRVWDTMTADKPVLYVHTEERFDLSLRVDVPSGLAVVEHYPPTTLAPLRWQARVGPHCAGAYPPVDDARCPDGYCEVAELPLYETPDAACLEVDAIRAPLLFYRLAAQGPAPSLPLAVRRDGEAMVVDNTGLRDPVGSLWRIQVTGAGVATTRVDVPALGQSARLGPGTEPVAGARAALRAELVGQGLTPPERDAFARAWDLALFGPAAADGDDGVVADEVDRPVDRLTDDRTTLTGPRLPDVLLYWLDRAGIDALAPIAADPAPSEVHRAFLVRVAP